MKQILRLNIILISILAGYHCSAQKGKKELTVGDKLPDVELSNIINYPVSKTRTSRFTGKPLIIDFWAPWCSPCLVAFPKLDSLQKKFKDQLQVLLVTKEKKQFSERLLNNLQKAKHIGSLASVVEDSLISKLLYHRVFPHYVWIDSEGTIQAITGAEEVTEQNIQQLVNGSELSLELKNDRSNQWDVQKPLFTGDQVSFKNEMLFHSILTKYIQGIPTTSIRRKNRIQCTSQSINLLYKIAFGEFDFAFMNNNRVILEGFNSSIDSLEIGRTTESTKAIWKEIRYDHVYNYELIVPDSSFTSKQMYEIMRQDLNRFFAWKGISGKREKRNVKLLELVRTSAEDKLKTKGEPAKDDHSAFYLKLQNQPLAAFITKLQAYFTNEGTLPIVNKTGYKEKIDMELNCDLTNINAVNKELEKYDLKLVEKQQEMEMIIITKAVKKPGYTATQ